MNSKSYLTSEQIQELIQELKRRLFFLEQQHARFGFNTPPEVLTEIDDIKEQLIDLQSLPKAIDQPHKSSQRKIAELQPQLQQMNDKLDTLLTRYKVSEQTIIATITGQLAQSQMTILLTILDVLETDRLSNAEMLQAVNAVQETLIALQQHNISLPGQEAIAKAIDDPTFDVTHKLKISLPIIPLLVEYEGELELGSEVNLKTVWERLIAKTQRQP